MTFLAMVASEIYLEILVPITKIRRLNAFCFVSHMKRVRGGKM